MFAGAFLIDPPLPQPDPPPAFLTPPPPPTPTSPPRPAPVVRAPPLPRPREAVVPPSLSREWPARIIGCRSDLWLPSVSDSPSLAISSRLVPSVGSLSSSINFSGIGLGIIFPFLIMNLSLPAVINSALSCLSSSIWAFVRSGLMKIRFAGSISSLIVGFSSIE